MREPGALVGRDAEVTALRRWLHDRAAAPSAAPPAWFVSGEAGIGKTALVEAVLPDLPTVRRGTAVPWASRPYAAVPPLLGATAGPVDEAELRQALLAEPRTRDRPVVVLLEDLHWADAASLALLPGLVAAVASDPVALVGTYRSDELPRDNGVRRLRTHLRHARLLGETALGPLDLDATRRLLGAALGGRSPAPRLLEVVVERTEGVPFFVEELAAALAAGDRLLDGPSGVDLVVGDVLPLPDSVRDAVLLRVADLPTPSRRALEAAAVLAATASSVDLDLLAAVVSGGWTDDLDETGFLVDAPDGRRRFRHALVREAVHDDIPWSQRRGLHLRVADVLERAGRPASEVAPHLVAGHDRVRARSALVRAAREHLAVHAWTDAARLLRTALDEWPAADETGRLAALDGLARASELSGDHVTAVRALDELVGHQVGAAELHRRLAAQHELLGHWNRALADRERAAAAYEAAGSPAEAAVERLAVAVHLRAAAGYRAALQELDRARPDARAAGRLDLVSRIDGLRGNLLVRAGRTEEGLPLVREALELALAHGLPAPAAEVYQRLADALEHLADYRAAGRAYASAVEFCDRHGQESLGQVCRACATVVMFQSGRWDQAVALGRQVRTEPSSTAHARAVAACVPGVVAALRGQPRLARSLLLDGGELAARIELLPCEQLATWGLALLEELAGRPERAAEGYRAALARCGRSEERHYSIPVLQFAVVALARVGAADDVGAATALLADAASRGDPEPTLALAAALGETALLQRRPGEAVTHLRRALDLADGLGLPLVDVLVRHRLAVALAATGPAAVGEAAALLAHGVRTAGRLQARLLVDRLTADLDRFGAPEVTGRLGGLSAREEQVVLAVGEGLTNRQIAARLFLSVRTVEMHMANAMRKLGSRTRAEAVQRLTTSRAATPVRTP